MTIELGTLKRFIITRIMQDWNTPDQIVNYGSVIKIARDLGLQAAECNIIFPQQMVDVIQQINQKIIQLTQEKIEQDQSFAITTSFSRKVSSATHHHACIVLDYINLVTNVLKYTTTHGYNLQVIRMAAKNASAIVRISGDQSINYTYYTKRAVMMAIYISVIVKILNHKTINQNDLEMFVNRQIAKTKKIQQLKTIAGNVTKVAARFPIFQIFKK